jgi:PKHD-type hydroxylase
MNQWWQYWPRHFSNEDCDKIIELALSLPVVDGRIGYGSDEAIENSDYRRSKIRWLPRFDGRFFGLFGNMQLLFQEGNRNAFGFDLSMFHEIQFTEYHATDHGKYDWHHDTTWTGSSLERRKLSMVIQLSDSADYEGGDFEMYRDDCDQVPDAQAIRQRGTVIMFPSFLRHRVIPVTKGLRYSLVSWHEGPAFR